MNPHPGYFGGSSVQGGKVRRLNAENFRQLVERYVNVPVQHPLTRKEFWELPSDKKRDEVKDGAYICACAFTYESEGHRTDDAATHSVAVVLDLDEGEFVKDFDENPDTIAEHLYPLNYVAWRTAKHRKEKPRLKVMVDIEPSHPKHHHRFVAFIASRLGLPSNFKGVRESKVVSQPQYRPLQFRGDDFTAVISSRVTGVPVHLSDLPELEAEELEMIEGRTYACDTSEAEDDFFGLAYLPVAGLKLDDIREALDTIDPDCNYKEWVEVAAALRHQFTDEDDAREAYEAFVEWSSRGSKFQGRRDCWNKWKSFRPYAKGRAPITIRTLYKLAMDAGWDNVKVAKKISQTVQEWMAACTDKDELMQDGAKRIVGMPFRNDVVEEALIISWRKRIQALTNESIDKATLKKEINKVRRADKKAKQDSRGENLPGWLRPFVYVATTDTFNSLGTGIALKPSAFDRFYAQQLMPKDETPANGIPIIQPSNYALNILNITRVEETLYDPTRSEDDKFFTDEESGRLILNTYNHNSVPIADPEFSLQAERLFRKLLAPLVKEPHLLEMLIDYLALQCQFPGRKIPWSFLIQSAPGAGKGTLGEVMQAVMGAVNVKIISPIQMAANFNEWATGAAFAVFNEVHIPGDRRDQVMNAIKPCISDPIISLNLKHRDGECRCKNFTNYIAFTNFKDAAHLAAEDRRWCIIFAPMQTKQQVQELDASGHFDQVRWLITPTGASALRYFLMKRVISEDFPITGHAPDTKYRTEVVAQSKNLLQTAIEDAIEDGIDPLISAEVIHDGRLREKVCRMPKDAVFLTRYLSLMGYERDGRGRCSIDGSRGYLWTHLERWQNGADPIEFLRKRLRDAPELDEPEFE